MTFPQRLSFHASELLGDSEDEPNDVNLRRSVSASYYALFHLINEDATKQIAPNVSVETNHRIQRWFEHARMKEICGRFLKSKLEEPLFSLIGNSASPDLQLVCDTFIKLQEARHEADYDPGYKIDFTEALQHRRSHMEAVSAWNRIKDTAEGNVFVLSLLLWKNWEEKKRR